MSEVRILSGTPLIIKKSRGKIEKIIDKTYLTKSGRDIRNCKMPGTYSINISEKNGKVAINRIESSEKRNATAVQYGNNAYAKQLIRKR